MSQAELDSNFIGLKGEVIYTAQTIGNTVALKKYNGNDLSFNVGGNQWYIPENTTVTVTENYQGFIYGDLYIDGNLQLDTGGQFVVLNGNVYLGSGGTITGSGDFYNIDLPTFDTFITGGTYNSGTSIITFTNNSGNTFVVTGITTGGSGSTGPISVSGTSLYSNNPATSNFSGTDSIFFGTNAGFQATGASNSNFLGFQAGQQATNANDSNFLGIRAGRQATNAYRSNFLGYYAGLGATNANDSNFLGLSAGNAATGASYSNFLGYTAGYSATSASYSNFLGFEAGYQATNASYSNLFGFNVGRTFTGNNLGSNNIIIGTNITLPNATANAINIGGVLFGTGTYSTTGGNPLTATTASGKIGIQVVTPTATLDVSGTTGYNQIRMRTSYTPSSSGDTNGNVGDIAWDNTYIYIKTNTGWGRTQLSYGF